MYERIRDALKGARRIEVFLLMILIALAGQIIVGSFSFETNEECMETALEIRLREIIGCIDGVEDPVVMISEAEDDVPCGVVIVARGVNDIETMLNVQNTVQTLLNVETSMIEIIDRK